MVIIHLEFGIDLSSTRGTITLGNPTPYKNNNAKEGNNKNSQRDKYGCLHGGEFLVCINIFYRCDKCGHMVRDCPQMRNQAKIDA